MPILSRSQELSILNREDRIKLVGLELEGFFESIPTFKGDFKGDSSVEISGHGDYDEDFECDGSCRDDCECFSECSCQMCIYCSECNEYSSNCNCYDCMFCSNCDEKMDFCNCTIEKQTECINIKCKTNEVCEECMAYFRESQETYHSCDNADHVQYSCDRDCNCNCECECNCNNGNDGSGRSGEFVSRPLEKTEIEEWIYKCYPTITNRTCGGHIHVSLKSNVDYMALMDRKFYDYYMKKILEWAKKMRINPESHFYERYNGKRFCYANFQPEQQRDMRDHYDDPRYAHINYAYNVENRHTVEFRLLPCFQKDYLMVSGVKETLKIVEDYLKKLPKQKSMRVKFVI